MDFSKIVQKNINGSALNTKGKISMFEAMMINYKSFVSKMDKSDFNNSSTRYMSELEFLQRLRKHAQEDGFSSEVENLDKKIALTEQILKDNFGICFKK